jgi:hypothetical protein
MTYAVDAFDDDAAVARLAGGDQAALDQAYDACLARTDVDPAIRGRAIGLLARVHDAPADQVSQPIPSWSPSKRCGSGARTRKFRYGTWGQSRSGGGGGIHTVG